MKTAVPLACFLSVIRPPGVQYENALLQIAPVDKTKCPYIKDKNDYSVPALMQRGDTNVIMVEASRLEAGPWYFTAAHNTWYIGQFAAKFIDYLVSRGLNLNTTHLIGHSLGAQAAGVAGGHLKTGRVAKITGLDPALPLFDHVSLEERLDPSDAHFVDVIHTDAGIFGYPAPVGHADFYPNGGKSPQPGCELEVVIPQHLFLNKCDGHNMIRGFRTFHLQATHQTVKHNQEVVFKKDSLQKSYLNRHENYKKDLNKYIDYMSDLTNHIHTKSQDVKSRRKRFVRLPNGSDAPNALLRVFQFFSRNKVPILTFMREINTIVKSANGELSHFTKESYVGQKPPFSTYSYNLQNGAGSGLLGLIKKLLGFGSGDKLTVISN
ncbi:hypothetical protein K1T71_014373 [Dendrolimus kikuchii]|uniref:Uncharacterized protein n=1 Tax=Dendrolimus kikuchii TaxID=765133 RepID=A0ACC1CE38_9NEOP|nr:hypothetical protein K1T71_014373 [Dendrolimus kikuchii]